jgi:hypothetical protein
MIRLVFSDYKIHNTQINNFKKINLKFNQLN